MWVAVLSSILAFPLFYWYHDVVDRPTQLFCNLDINLCKYTNLKDTTGQYANADADVVDVYVGGEGASWMLWMNVRALMVAKIVMMVEKEGAR